MGAFISNFGGMLDNIVAMHPGGVKRTSVAKKEMEDALLAKFDMSKLSSVDTAGWDAQYCSKLSKQKSTRDKFKCALIGCLDDRFRQEYKKLQARVRATVLRTTAGMVKGENVSGAVEYFAGAKLKVRV